MAYGTYASRLGRVHHRIDDSSDGDDSTPGHTNRQRPVRHGTDVDGTVGARSYSYNDYRSAHLNRQGEQKMKWHVKSDWIVVDEDDERVALTGLRKGADGIYRHDPKL